MKTSNPTPQIVWSEDSGDSYSWSAVAVVYFSGEFFVQSDSGCSCNSPFQDLDKCPPNTEEDLVLSPHWEGFNDPSTKAEVLAALRKHPQCPNWALDTNAPT